MMIKEQSTTVTKDEPELSTNNTTDIKSFHYLEDGSIDFSILHTKYTRKRLDSGVYSIGIKIVGGSAAIDLKQTDAQESYNADMDHYFSDKMENIYRAFFDMKVKKRVKRLGYKHKFGVLLHGKQGTGKTTMLRKYFEQIVNDHNGLVFIFDTYENLDFMWSFIQKIRVIQDNPIICFMDEILFRQCPKAIMDYFD